MGWGFHPHLHGKVRKIVNVLALKQIFADLSPIEKARRFGAILYPLAVRVNMAKELSVGHLTRIPSRNGGKIFVPKQKVQALLRSLPIDEIVDLHLMIRARSDMTLGTDRYKIFTLGYAGKDGAN
jgi:hypothetical protein